MGSALKMPNKYLRGLASRLKTIVLLTAKSGSSLWGWWTGVWRVIAVMLPRDEATRIISVRKHNRREKKIYQERLGTH